MIKRPILSLYVCLLSLFSYGQNPVPPLDIPLKLSGTFGEFRPTHFHAGLDIKTQGKEGFDVKSIKAGSIRRIRVSTSGYGKCVYIQHADGTTTVYAHLQKFAPKIQAFIKALQYEKEVFEIQRFPSLGEIEVEKGEVIGYSGNTGGSFGPHLHFEIRDTKAETPLNPLHLGFEVPDSIRPIIQGVYRYSMVDKKQGEKTDIPLTRINDSVYSANILKLGGDYGFGVRLFDRQDLSYNRNGIYHAELRVNGSLNFSYTFDKIDFSDGKKIDALIDYSTYKKERVRIQKFFRNYDVEYSFLRKSSPNGIIHFEKNRSYKVELIVQDFEKNTSYVNFYVEGVRGSKPKEIPILNEILPSKDYLYEFPIYQVYIPQETFYEPVNLSVNTKADTLIIGEVNSPQNKGFELSVYPNKKNDSLSHTQLTLALFDPEEKKEEDMLRYVSTLKKDGVLFTKFASPGTYVLTKDSLPPTIKPLNFKEEQWVSNYKFLQLEIDDDFSGIKSYHATINDRWVLFEYEPKDNLIFYDFNDIDFDKTELDLKIEIEDNVGNKTLFTSKLFRKPTPNKTR